MNEELEEARKAQFDAWRIGCALEADYALLAATQRAIDAQTVECIDCCGYGYRDGDGCICQTCGGRGRVRKDGV